MHGGNRFSLIDDSMKDTIVSTNIAQLLKLRHLDIMYAVGILTPLHKPVCAPSHLPLHQTHSCALMC